MINILNYIQKDGHFEVQINKLIEGKDVKYSYEFKSNSELATSDVPSTNLTKVTGNLLFAIKTLGRVSRVEIDSTGDIITGEEIKTIDFKFEKGKVKILLESKKEVLVDINDMDFDADAFGDDKYKNDLDVLLNKIEHMYKENALETIA